VQTAVVPWGFDDDLIGTDAIHQVVKTFRPSTEIAFNP
jgi:hypothetical protein